MNWWKQRANDVLKLILIKIFGLFIILIEFEDVIIKILGREMSGDDTPRLIASNRFYTRRFPPVGLFHLQVGRDQEKH